MSSESFNDFCSWFDKSKYALMAKPLFIDDQVKLGCVNCQHISVVYPQQKNGWNISKFVHRHLNIDKESPYKLRTDVTMSLETTDTLPVSTTLDFTHFLYV